jgi:hypothetical protein
MGPVYSEKHNYPIEKVYFSVIYILYKFEYLNDQAIL